MRRVVASRSRVGLSSSVVQGLRRLVLPACPRGKSDVKASNRSNWFLVLSACRSNEGSAPQAVEDPVQRGALFFSYSTELKAAEAAEPLLFHHGGCCSYCLEGGFAGDVPTSRKQSCYSGPRSIHSRMFYGPELLPPPRCSSSRR